MKGFSLLETLVTLTLMAGATTIYMDIHQELEPKAIQISEYEKKKTQQLCKFRNFEGCQ